LWIGIPDRPIKVGVLFPIRKALLLFVPADIPEEAVHERDDMAGTDSFGLGHRFIDRSGFRHAIHKKDLVKGDTEEVEHRGGDLPEWKVGIPLDDPVEMQPPPKHALDEVVQKGPIPLRKIRT